MVLWQPHCMLGLEVCSLNSDTSAQCLPPPSSLCYCVVEQRKALSLFLSLPPSLQAWAEPQNLEGLLASHSPQDPSSLCLDTAISPKQRRLPSPCKGSQSPLSLEPPAHEACCPQQVLEEQHDSSECPPNTKQGSTAQLRQKDALLAPVGGTCADP